MKTRMYSKRHGWTAILLATMLCPCVESTAQEADTPDPARRGKVVQLPASQSGDQRSHLLAGHVRLLNKTIEQAIDDLQHGELRAFFRSYRRMVEAYGQLADHVADASTSLGQAQARVRLAERSLAEIEATPTDRGQARQQLVEDVGQVRVLLIGRLTSLRQRYIDGSPEDQKKLVGQIQGLVGRVRQLDQLKSSLARGSRPLLPGLASSDLRRQLDEIGQALEEEDRTLGVVAQSVGLLVESTTSDMQRTIRLLEVQARIPNEQLLQLAETRQSVQNVLDEVLQAHAIATNAAQNILAAGEAQQVTDDPVQLLREVDALLQPDP